MSLGQAGGRSRVRALAPRRAPPRRHAFATRLALAPLLGLAGLAAGAGARAGGAPCPEAAVLDLVLLQGDQAEPRSVCAPGQRPEPYADALLARLRDPAFLGGAVHLASLAPSLPVTVSLQLLDDGRLRPGERLRVPRPTRKGGLERTEHTVGPGETLADLARQTGFSVRQLELVNDERFQVLPVTLARRQARRVLLGEAGLAALHATTPDLTASELVGLALLHELAHAADAPPCNEALTERYGPDLRHFDLELLSPVAAFSEGWADYQALHQASGARRRLEQLPRAARVEVAGRWPATGRYRWILPWDLTAADLLATKEGVARLLLALEEVLPGGRAALEAAFLQDRRSCRHLGDLLATLARTPGGAAALEVALAAELGPLATPLLEATLAGGGLAGGGLATAPPRSRRYRPRPPPRRAPPALRRPWAALWRRRAQLDASGAVVPELGLAP